MGDKTGIAWTDATWNPLRGCSRVSPGCARCYAETIAARFSGPGQPYAGLATTVNGHPRWTGKIMLVPHLLDQPLRWKKPRMIFVNSMSDLFHPGVPDAFIVDVFAVMAAAPQHVFQILTKRPERMAVLARSFDFRKAVRAKRVTLPSGGITSAPKYVWPLPNVWLGTSVEDQQRADERLPYLLDTPAAVRFISAEPLLGPISLSPDACEHLSWCIVGAESGSGARPMDIEWARRIKNQCVAAGVPFFLKQFAVNGRKVHQPVLDGRTWEQFPAMSSSNV